MAASASTRSAPFGAVSVFHLFNGLDNALGNVIAWNDARVTRKALNRLSDRELDDIGLSRADIAYVAELR